MAKSSGVVVVDAVFPTGYTRSDYVEDMESRSNQSDKDSCDINVILRQYIRTGQLPPPKTTPSYVDLTLQPDLHKAVNMYGAAMSVYYELPVDIQDKFKKPSDFVDFCLDPRNSKDLLDMGLAVSRPAEGTPSAGAPVAQAKASEPVKTASEANGGGSKPA
ncbi:MAG: internal scaffolding protein [Microviridae sp.]|nr:MAG: internal scaffolding protein [Microviridae sp.]